MSLCSFLFPLICGHHVRPSFHIVRFSRAVLRNPQKLMIVGGRRKGGRGMEKKIQWERGESLGLTSTHKEFIVPPKHTAAGCGRSDSSSTPLFYSDIPNSLEPGVSGAG